MIQNIETLVNCIKDFHSLQELFLKLNFDFMDMSASKDCWNTNEISLIQKAKIIAVRGDYKIYYIQTNAQSQTDYTNIASKLIKYNLGLCMICLHNPIEHKWIFSCLSKTFSEKFSEKNDIIIHIKSNITIDKRFVNFFKKIYVEENSATSIVKKISNAFDLFIDHDFNEHAEIRSLLTKNDLSRLILAYICKKTDSDGRVLLEIYRSFDVDRNEIAKSRQLLKSNYLISETNNEVKITKKGKKALQNISKTEISNEIKTHSNNLLEILDIQTHFAPSLLCNYLGKPESGYEPISLKEGNTNLFWIKTLSSDIQKKCQEKFNFMKEKLLENILQINYSVTPLEIFKKISINTKMNFFVTQQIIKGLTKTNTLTSSGESWKFPLEQRVWFFLRVNSDKVYTVNEIISSILAPTLEKKNIGKILEKLESEKKIIKIDNHNSICWTRKINESSKIKKILHDKLVVQIKHLLMSNKIGVDRDILINKMEGMIHKYCREYDINRLESITDVLEYLEKNNKITIRANMYRYVNNLIK